MHNRVMRSGRTYNPGVVPEGPRRRTRKGKAAVGPKADALVVSDSAEETNGEQTENEEKRLITFGSLHAGDCGMNEVGQADPTRRLNVAWASTGGVMVSPAVYQSLTGCAPPIRRSPRYITFGYYPRNDTDAHHEVDDACNEADAPTKREDAPAGTPRAADRALGAELAPADADRAPGTKKTPEAHENEPGLGLTCEGNDRVDKRDPQYVVLDSPSPIRVLDSHDNSRLSWFEEKCRAEGNPDSDEELPELDIDWYRDHWSRSEYLSASNYDGDSEADVEDMNDLRVSAVICEVDENYVLDDDEYEAVVLRLQAEEYSRRGERSQAPSQTSGAGPSGIRRSSGVSIEEVEDVDAPHIVLSSDDSDEIEYIPTNKWKGKTKEKPPTKRKARPSLGIILDDLEPKVKAEPEPSEGRRSNSKMNYKKEEMPDGFRSGGYLEAKYGEPKERSNRSSVRSVPQYVRNRSQSGSRRLGGPGNRESRSGTATEHNRSAIYVGSEPSDSPSGSDSDKKDNSSNESDDSHIGRNASNQDILRLLKKLQKENKKLKAKSKKHARSGYKAQAPKTYKGEEPDIEEYEQFIFDYDNWVIETGLDRESAVRNVSRFLGGKAGRCYMAGIAPNLRKVEYKMKDVYKLLYSYCFPPDFKETLRKKYERLNQGERSVQDFFADLDLYRNRLNDITDAQHARRAWDGSARYIRAEWANRGLRPERVTVEELKESALDIERANKIKRTIEHDTGRKDNHKRNRSRSPDRKKDYKNDRSNKSSSHNSNNQSRNNRDRSENWKKSKSNEGSQSNQRSNQSKLTDEQKDKYRAEDRCFICHKVGHISRNCNKINTAKPTGIKTNAVTVQTEAKVRASSAMLKELDKMHRLRDKIELSAVRVCASSVQIHAMKHSKHKVDTQGYVERNSVRVRDNTRLVPQTIVVRAKLNGESIRVLLDSGSQADILSTTIVDQLKVNKIALTKPLQLQLAISGSKSIVNYGAKARLQYQDIDEEREFDVGNLDRYDAILGTPWLYQHSVSLSFNPTGVVIGSVKPLPLEGEEVLRINSVSTDIIEARMEDLRQMLKSEAQDLCPDSVASTPLPPFRKINHRIPLIDDNKVYKFRPSKCAEKLRPLFDAKAREYLQSARWELATGSNAVPMLIIPKKSTDGTLAIRTVLDKREQNDNTKKLASPLPPTEDVLLNVSRKKFRSVIDGKDAYEQIRIVEEDVPKTLFHTPMGTMVSLVMQIGDCNAGATYQSLMNHLFQAYISVFMYVYLDDIVILEKEGP